MFAANYHSGVPEVLLLWSKRYKHTTQHRLVPNQESESRTNSCRSGAEDGITRSFVPGMNSLPDFDLLRSVPDAHAIGLRPTSVFKISVMTSAM